MCPFLAFINIDANNWEYQNNLLRFGSTFNTPNIIKLGVETVAACRCVVLMVMEDIEEVVDGGYRCRVMTLVDVPKDGVETGGGEGQDQKLRDGLPSEWQVDVFTVSRARA